MSVCVFVRWRLWGLKSKDGVHTGTKEAAYLLCWRRTRPYRGARWRL